MNFGSLTSYGVHKFRLCTLLAIVCLLPTALLNGQATAYFSSAYGLQGSALKSHLQSIIDGHTSLSYTPGIWDAHKDLYEDPADSSKLILFYSELSFNKSAQDPGSGSTQYWNREHLWPNSYGIDGDRPAYTDLFHLVPANKSVNGDRSNKYFDYANPSDGNYEDPANSLAPTCIEDANSWEPGDNQKGWAARAMLYMDTRYSHLTLVDTPPSATPSSSANRMAQLSVMLEWNRKFPPSPKELEINQRIYDDYQGNRNPYIDFPEFADLVWVSGQSWGGWRLAHFSLVELLDPAISGDSADPDLDGLTNIVEMSRYSDPRNPDNTKAIDGIVSGNSLLITFQRARDFSNLNLELVLESSDDFVTWNPVSLSGASITVLNSTTESVTVTQVINQNTPPFYRLNAMRP
ncbi:MAG: endonuclease I family protein [Puniceicoccaceae bacterium]